MSWLEAQIENAKDLTPHIKQNPVRREFLTVNIPYCDQPHLLHVLLPSASHIDAIPDLIPENTDMNNGEDYNTFFSIRDVPSLFSWTFKNPWALRSILLEVIHALFRYNEKLTLQHWEGSHHLALEAKFIARLHESMHSQETDTSPTIELLFLSRQEGLSFSGRFTLGEEIGTKLFEMRPNASRERIARANLEQQGLMYLGVWEYAWHFQVDMTLPPLKTGGRKALPRVIYPPGLEDLLKPCTFDWADLDDDPARAETLLQQQINLIRNTLGRFVDVLFEEWLARKNLLRELSAESPFLEAIHVSVDFTEVHFLTLSLIHI